MPNRRARRAAVVSSRLKGFKYLSQQLVSPFSNAWKTVRSGWSNADSGSGGTHGWAWTNAPADYPINVVRFTTPDIDVIANYVGAGSGIAFWVTDASNWWALATDQLITDKTDTYCTSYYQYTTSNSGCGCYGYSYTYYNSYSYSCVTGSYCRYSSINGPNYCNYFYGVCYGQNGPFTGYGTSCPNACYATGCNGYTTEKLYEKRWRILRSINNVVSAVATATFDAIPTTNGVASTTVENNFTLLKVFFRGGKTATPKITARAYRPSTTAEQPIYGSYVQLGSDLVHEPTGMNVIANYGLIAVPSAYNENVKVGTVEFKTENLQQGV